MDCLTFFKMEDVAEYLAVQFVESWDDYKSIASLTPMIRSRLLSKNTLLEWLNKRMDVQGSTLWSCPVFSELASEHEEVCDKFVEFCWRNNTHGSGTRKRVLPLLQPRAAHGNIARKKKLVDTLFRKIWNILQRHDFEEKALDALVGRTRMAFFASTYTFRVLARVTQTTPVS